MTFNDGMTVINFNLHRRTTSSSSYHIKFLLGEQKNITAKKNFNKNNLHDQTVLFIT